MLTAAPDRRFVTQRFCTSSCVCGAGLSEIGGVREAVGIPTIRALVTTPRIVSLSASPASEALPTVRGVILRMMVPLESMRLPDGVCRKVPDAGS